MGLQIAVLLNQLKNISWKIMKKICPYKADGVA